MVLVSTLAILTVMAAFTIVLLVLIKKKRERKIQNQPVHVYDSVLQPPRTLVTSSKPSKLDADLHEDMKTTSCSTDQFELADNEVYCSSSSKPPCSIDQIELTDNGAYCSSSFKPPCSTDQIELAVNKAYCSSSFKPPAEAVVVPGADP